MKLRKRSAHFVDTGAMVFGILPPSMAGCLVKLMDDRGQEVETYADKDGRFAFKRHDMAFGSDRKGGPTLALNYDLVVEAGECRLRFQLPGQESVSVVLEEAT